MGQDTRKKKKSSSRRSTSTRRLNGARTGSAPKSHVAVTDIAGALALAESQYTHDQESEIVSTLAPFASQRESLPPELKRRLISLRALGMAHTNQLIDAESEARQLADHSPDSPDAWYVLTFVHLAMREYDKAIDAGMAYLERAEAAGEKARGLGSYCSSPAHQSQLLNMLATAYNERGKRPEAESYYQRSIQSDSGNHLPYLNLAGLYKRLGRHDEAQSIIAEGIRRAREGTELRMLANSPDRGTTVSACMIVKNEEEMLGECLQSIRDWVSEIIVVDTGSTDRTVEIAESYGAKVFHQAWEGNFSKARNISLSHATGDWIFIIDADERMIPDGLEQLRKLLNDRNAQLISINVFNVYGDGDSGMTFLPSIRLFRRSLGLSYEGIVHNVLVYPEDMPVFRAGMRLKHLGYGLSPEKMKQKIARSRALLETQLQEDPDNAFALFNYAQLLRGETSVFPAHNVPLILNSALRAIELTSPNIPAQRHIHLMCLDQVAWTHFHQGNFDLASEYARRALACKPNYLDPMLLLGHAAARQQKYDEAIVAYEQYLHTQAAYNPSQETDNIILLHVDSRPSAWYSLGVIAELRGETAQAQKYYELIVGRDPGYLDTNSHLGRLALARHDLDSAERWYRAQLKHHPEGIDACRQLGQILLSRHQFVEAERMYKQGLEIDPGDSSCLIGLGRVYSDWGRPGEAAAIIEQALSAGADNRGLRRELASAYFQAGRYADAANTLTALIQGSSVDGDLANDLGNACFKMERYDEAVNWYQRSIESSSATTIAHRNLGLALARSGKSRAAIEALGRYVEFEPEAFDIVGVVADLSMRTAQYEIALNYLEKYLKLRPNDPSAMFQLAECYLLLGHKDSAILGYRRALLLNPEFEPAANRLAELLPATSLV
jgi:tetratricopeptide (TPR) repeat protein